MQSEYLMFLTLDPFLVVGLCQVLHRYFRGSGLLVLKFEISSSMQLP